LAPGGNLEPSSFLQYQAPTKKCVSESAMETATAVEIDKGRLRQLLLDDFHKLFGKAFAKKPFGFPTVITAPTMTLFLREGYN
jgi:hypothetical protein